jgi:hypothetical protein
MQKRTSAIRGGDAGLFTTILYPGISHRTSWVDLDGMLWLNRQIHFSNWNEDAIRTAGTTHSPSGSKLTEWTSPKATSAKIVKVACWPWEPVFPRS